jgi:hypothetical protein
MSAGDVKTLGNILAVKSMGKRQREDEVVSPLEYDEAAALPSNIAGVVSEHKRSKCAPTFAETQHSSCEENAGGESTEMGTAVEKVGFFDAGAMEEAARQTKKRLKV